MTFSHSTPATLLFFSTDKGVGFRVAASDISKEFAGQDYVVFCSPDDATFSVNGTLSYDNLKDLNGIEEYKASTGKSGDTMTIKFYKTLEGKKKCIAEFISESYVLPTGVIVPFDDKFHSREWNNVIASTMLIKQYTILTRCFGIFLYNSDDSTDKILKALRVEAPEIKKQFTDTAYIGTDRDFEGLLCYNDMNDVVGKYTDTVSNFIDISYSTRTRGVRIQFCKDQNCVMEYFTAPGSNYAIEPASFDSYVAEGQYGDLSIGGSAIATLSKKNDENKILVTALPIHKEATISNQNHFWSGQSFDVKGTLHFRDIKKLNGECAIDNWHYLAFCDENSTPPHFYAYFTPDDPLPEEAATSTDTSYIRNVEWNDTA